MQASPARIQEQFDTQILGIERNPLIKAVPTDEVVDLGTEYDRRGKSQKELEGWYPPILSRLPDNIVTAVCQRINSRWDEKLRILYIRFLMVVTIIFVVFVATVGLSLDLSLRGIFLFTLLPLFPGVKFLLQQIQENRATTTRLRSLAEHSDARLDALTRGNETPSTARNVQDEIYQHRKSAALIPDWFFTRYRTNQELSMTAYAEHLVEKAESN